jgi:hypothetical protein
MPRRRIRPGAGGMTQSGIMTAGAAEPGGEIILLGSATTNRSAPGTSYTINLPASITAGEFLLIQWINDNEASGAAPTATGWSFEQGTLAGTCRIGMGYKTATGSEGATVNFSTSSSAYFIAVASRWSGVDVADPLHGSNWQLGVTGTIDPFTLAANTITGVLATSKILLQFGGESGDRTIVTGDAALTLINGTTGGAGGTSNIHALYEDVPGTGNAAYSIDMSTSLAWRWLVTELKAA